MAKTHAELDNYLAIGIEAANKRLKAYEELLEELKVLCQSHVGHPRHLSTSVFAEILINKIEQFQAESNNFKCDKCSNGYDWMNGTPCMKCNGKGRL